MRAKRRANPRRVPVRFGIFAHSVKFLHAEITVDIRSTVEHPILITLFGQITDPRLARNSTIRARCAPSRVNRGLLNDMK